MNSPKKYSTDRDTPAQEAWQTVYICLIGALALAAFGLVIVGVIYLATI